jgi:aryl-alcohol dehydrogenase-like predicted oxidoreductase
MDTAELYGVPVTQESAGTTETFIGRWMKARNCRKEMVIATKVASKMEKNFVAANRCAYGRFECNLTNIPTTPTLPIGFVNLEEQV